MIRPKYFGASSNPTDQALFASLINPNTQCNTNSDQSFYQQPTNDFSDQQQQQPPQQSFYANPTNIPCPQAFQMNQPQQQQQQQQQFPSNIGQKFENVIGGLGMGALGGAAVTNGLLQHGRLGLKTLVAARWLPILMLTLVLTAILTFLFSHQKFDGTFLGENPLEMNSHVMLKRLALAFIIGLIISMVIFYITDKYVNNRMMH